MSEGASIGVGVSVVLRYFGSRLPRNANIAFQDTGSRAPQSGAKVSWMMDPFALLISDGSGIKLTERGHDGGLSCEKEWLEK